MFTYQKSSRFFAQVAEGLENLAEKELQAHGAQEIKPAHRGFYFSADWLVAIFCSDCSLLQKPIASGLMLSFSRASSHSSVFSQASQRSMCL
jgi:23S rRNA G2445 N2-methylase RlmL